MKTLYAKALIWIMRHGPTPIAKGAADRSLDAVHGKKNPHLSDAEYVDGAAKLAERRVRNHRPAAPPASETLKAAPPTRKRQSPPRTNALTAMRGARAAIADDRPDLADHILRKAISDAS